MGVVVVDVVGGSGSACSDLWVGFVVFFFVFLVVVLSLFWPLFLPTARVRPAFLLLFFCANISNLFNRFFSCLNRYISCLSFFRISSSSCVYMLDRSSFVSAILKTNLRGLGCVDADARVVD